MITRVMNNMKSMWKTRRTELAAEFYFNIADLITDERVQELDKHNQHYGYTRLKHSLDVSYYSFLMTKMFGWDSRSAARGGLLHDLYYHDWRDEEWQETGLSHATNHPKIALENARKVCYLNRIEEDIILKHMWLITVKPPKYKEGFVVTFIDKYCALKEFSLGVLSRKKGPRSLFATL